MPDEKEWLDYILRVMRLIDTTECDEIGWTTTENVPDPNAKHGWKTIPRTDPPVMFHVNCNDLFWWATADSEEVPPDKVEMLEKAYADVEAMEKSIVDDEEKACNWQPIAQILYACRSRNMRPQGAYYKHVKKAFWRLLDEAGPERETDQGPFGNPKKPGE
jgi:hypothetical protein